MQYTATDFHGWSKMTLKIKAAYFFIFGKAGFYLGFFCLGGEVDPEKNC